MEVEDITHYISRARHLTSQGWYVKAFDLFMVAFEKCPEAKNHYEVEFREVLHVMAEALATAGRLQEMFGNFERALKVYPNNIYVLNDIGKYLSKFGFNKEAMRHFLKALRYDSGFVDAEKNLNSVKNMLVERWHFRMLNDKTRNKAYRDAIHKSLQPFSDSVIDIGTGTGLLSIYATECKPVSIVALDGSETMAEIATTVLNDNDCTLTEVCNKMSTDVDYSNVYGKRSLVITELFDAGLLGENILPTLSHAWDELLSDNGRVLPMSAEFFVVGAKCNQLNEKYQLGIPIKNLLNVCDENIHITTYGETYDCEDVHLFNDIKYVTDSQSVLKVDFNSVADIEDKMNRAEPFNVELRAKEDGEVNVIIGWFNLHLTDEITITTNPTAENRASAWQQAIFFDKPAFTMKEGQTINLKFSTSEEKISLLPVGDEEIVRVSPEALRFLNDTEFVNKITTSIGMISLYLGQICEMSEMNVADLCPFPLFGMLMLKREANSLICYAKTEFDSVFLEDVFRMNDISLDRVNILTGDQWSAEVFGDLKCHAIFTNICDVCGDVDLRMREISSNLRSKNLVPGGLFIPSSVKLMGQLISSQWIDINNRVYDENVDNYVIAKYINPYQVSQIFCVDPENLEYTALSEPVTLAAYEHDMIYGEISVPIIKDGEANAILCWYNIELIKDLGELSTKRTESFIDCSAYLANPNVSVSTERPASILRCVDDDGALKLIIDDST